MMDSLLGDNWLSLMLGGQYDSTYGPNVTRYNTLKEDPGVAQWIETLKGKYTGLTEVLNKLAVGEKLSEEEQLALAQAFISEGVTSADKYNQHIQAVVESISGLTSTSTKTKLSAMGSVFADISKYSDMASTLNRNRGRSGSQLDADGLALVEEITGLSETAIKDLGVDVMDLIFSGIEEEVKSGTTDRVGKTIASTLVASLKAH